MERITAFHENDHRLVPSVQQTAAPFLPSLTASQNPTYEMTHPPTEIIHRVHDSNTYTFTFTYILGSVRFDRACPLFKEFLIVGNKFDVSLLKTFKPNEK